MRGPLSLIPSINIIWLTVGYVGWMVNVLLTAFVAYEKDRRWAIWAIIASLCPVLALVAVSGLPEGKASHRRATDESVLIAMLAGLPMLAMSVLYLAALLAATTDLDQRESLVGSAVLVVFWGLCIATVLQGLNSARPLLTGLLLIAIHAGASIILLSLPRDFLIGEHLGVSAFGAAFYFGMLFLAGSDKESMPWWYPLIVAFSLGGGLLVLTGVVWLVVKLITMIF